MTAPDKMWREIVAKCPMYPDGGAFYYETQPAKVGFVEYTRSDLIPTAAYVARLEAALEWYADDSSSQGDIARAALAAAKAVQP